MAGSPGSGFSSDLAIAALILALVPLVAVFGYIFANGIGSFTSLDFLVKDPPPDLTATEAAFATLSSGRSR